MNTSKSLFCIILLFTLWECKKESEPAPIVVIPKKYDINLIFDNKSGSVTSGITTVIAGESVMVTISPNTGYLISSVKINGIEQVVSKSYELKDVKSNIEIRVEFVIDNKYLFI
jgi:serine/threonine-protein kinase